MKNILSRLLIITSSLFVLNACVSNESDTTSRFSVLYIYGDVSAEGDVPSNNKAPFEPMRLSDKGPLGLSEFNTALTTIGANAVEAYDQDIVLTEEYLNNYDVVLLASNQRRFSPAEAQSVNNWVNNGGGLIIWSDSAFGGHWNSVGVDNELGRLSDNDISTQFGMYFLTDNGAGNYLVSHFTEDHYLNDFNKDGGIRFRGEGVSLVRTSAPAKVLATLEDGGLGGELKVNKVDQPYNKETDAVLSSLEPGKGRVIGLFDRNLFWNAGAGTRYSHVDNREFSQRLVLWAAQKETGAIQPQPAVNKHKLRDNKPPTAIVHSPGKIIGNKGIISATINDDGQPLTFPEVEWRQIEGPADALFDNQNRFTPVANISFPKPGKYVFTLTVTDGDLEIMLYTGVDVVAE